MTVLVVEDEPAIADTLVYALKTEGFEPVWRTTGGEALAELAARPVALVVLDVGLPDANGFELCKTIRARSAVPILFLTARSSEVDRIVGLEIGGDDYVTKPFSPREVSARVKAILRRGSGAAAESAGTSSASPMGSPGEAAAAGGTGAGNGSGAAAESAGAAGPGRAAKDDGFAHDAERCEIRFRGKRLDLTRYEYRLLKTLLARPGRVYTRDELMTQAWEDPGASLDRTVDAHIKTLRAKLRAAAGAQGTVEGDPIQTHRGLGYSLRVT